MYIQFCITYLFISNKIESKRVTSIVLVQFIPTGLWLSCYTNTLVLDLALYIILSELLQIVHILIWANLTLWRMSTIHSTFSNWLIMSNFSSVLIVFHRFFTSLALGDVYLHFSLIFIPKANADNGGINISRMLVSPMSTIHTYDWWHDSDVNFS